KHVPGQLPGTGWDESKLLFAAARELAQIWHVDNEPPEMPGGSACPVSQTGPGAECSHRRIGSETFVQHAVQTAANEARAVPTTAYKAVQEATLNLLLDDALKGELQEVDPTLAAACDTLQTELKARQKATISAAGEKLSWAEIPKLSGNPGPALDAHTVA